MEEISKMSAEELGRLFPIILTDYNPEWPKIYERESKKIIKAIGQNAAAISHIGSTAVKGLKAKPAIDILLEIKEDTDLEAFKNTIISLGYEFSEQLDNPPPHMTFYKGYTPEGFLGQAYHLHIRYKGQWDEIIFRDYLRTCEKARQEYVELKTSLQKQFKFDREGYTKAKTDFIKEALFRAKIKVRVMEKKDYYMLSEFLYQAIYVPKGQKLPPKTIINEPEIFIYIKDFGKLAGDLGVVSEHDGNIVGMAWARIIPGYGHLDKDTPELAISIVPKFRGKGVGTMLMDALFNLLVKNGYKRTSLSVQKNNPAVQFYKRLGYKVSGESIDCVGHEDYLMVKELEKSER